jgi:hypothetical protein
MLHRSGSGQLWVKSGSAGAVFDRTDTSALVKSPSHPLGSSSFQYGTGELGGALLEQPQSFSPAPRPHDSAVNQADALPLTASAYRLSFLQQIGRLLPDSAPPIPSEYSLDVAVCPPLRADP